MKESRLVDDSSSSDHLLGSQSKGEPVGDAVVGASKHMPSGSDSREPLGKVVGSGLPDAA